MTLKNILPLLLTFAKKRCGHRNSANMSKIGKKGFKNVRNEFHNMKITKRNFRICRKKGTSARTSL